MRVGMCTPICVLSFTHVIRKCTVVSSRGVKSRHPCGPASKISNGVERVKITKIMNKEKRNGWMTSLSGFSLKVISTFTISFYVGFLVLVYYNRFELNRYYGITQYVHSQSIQEQILGPSARSKPGATSSQEE